MPLGIELEEELAQAKLTRAVLRRGLRFVRPYLPLFLAGMAFNLAWVVSYPLITLIQRYCIDKLIPHHAFGPVAVWATVCGIIYLGRAAADMGFVRCAFPAGIRVIHDLRVALFNHLQALSMRYFDRTKHGRIIARVDRDVETLEVLIWIIPDMMAVTIMVFVYFAFLFSLDWRLALLVVIPLPIAVVTAVYFRRHQSKAWRRIRESIARITAEFAESIAGIRVIQAFVRGRRNSDRFAEMNRAHSRNVVRQSVHFNLFFPINTIMQTLTAALIFLYPVWINPDTTITVGTLFFFVRGLWMIFMPIEFMTFMYNDLLSANAAFERIFLLLDTKPEVIDREEAPELPAVRGDVRFDHVTFRYEDKGKWILKDIDFSVRAGDTIAFVGHTGAGKSSVISLIARFYDPQRGSITVDGIDLRDVQQRSLHRQMGIVLQENFLFSGTVMDNIKYGNPGVSDREAIRAARRLGSHRFIMRLPHGYRTQVRERGRGVSRGERQLICLTRALVANPRIFVMDEATSAVDTRTEAAIQKALLVLTRGRTCFVVAHRLSTIRGARRILVMRNGRIVERGSHRELLRKRGYYTRLYLQYARRTS